MKRCISFLFFILTFICGCGEIGDKNPVGKPSLPASPYVVVLGSVQDGGSPHPGCKKKCCEKLFEHPDPQRKVTALAVVDPVSGQTWLFEASPDIVTQLNELSRHRHDKRYLPDAIFLTHAHIGHYAGLMYLGREALGSKDVKVYAMPRMREFLSQNGPWSQLIVLQNVQLHPLKNDSTIQLSPRLKVTPFLVPHRDEFSETVGFFVEGKKKFLFIPDIDKWSKWQRNIVEEIKKVDYAFIDGTFYDTAEIHDRDMSEIPHPFVTESMAFFKDLPAAEKKKINFIHFNHTNPLLDNVSAAYLGVRAKGFSVAQKGQVFSL
jgi:pyrroloquinoline quinone biosynthesis protein B